MRPWILAGIIAVLSSNVFAQAIWVGPGGGGMMAVQEAATLEPGHFGTSFVLDNYDRDPLGIDVFDARIDWRLAVVHRLEVFGRFHISRGVSVPGAVPVPSSPLDIVALDGGSPRPPYRAMYWPMPYLSHHPSRMSDMLPGEYALGLKFQLAYQHDWSPAMSISVQASIPGDMTQSVLAKGSGSGALDVSVNGATTWKAGRLSVSANLGATHNGKLKMPDRIITPDGATDEPITRPMTINAGVGARLRILPGISAMAEAYGWTPIGTATPQFDAAGASDVLVGLDIRYKCFGLTAGFRQHLSPPANGMVLPTGPLAGALDLTALSDTDQRNYLGTVGIDQALHRPGAGLVVLGTQGRTIPDPPGSRHIANTYLTHTTGNDGIVAAFSISF